MMDFSFMYKTRSGLVATLFFVVLCYLAKTPWHQLSVLLLAIPIITFLYINNLYSYWERENVPFIPVSFPFGWVKDVFLQRASLVEVLLDMYDKTGKNKYVGVYSFMTPQLIIKDIDIVKNILVKDFSNFSDRGVYVNPKVDPLTNNMFSLEGQTWKTLRAKISPTFTSGKLKTMFPTVRDVATDLKAYTEELVSNSESVNIKELIGRYGLDVISSVALGLEGNNFKEYYTDMRRITEQFSAPSGIQLLRTLISILSRDLARLLRIRMTSKEVEEYFFHITKTTMKYRQENNVQRNDFMQLLMGLDGDIKHSNGAQNGSSTSKDQFKLTLSELAAQSFIFVVAGYDTTSIAMCFFLYELALNPEVQVKLLEEIDSVEDDVPYEDLLKLPYLDMVISETLRKHTPLPVLQRECAKDYEMPDGKIIKAGTVCIIPIIGIQRDPELFPDPEKFDPERFNKDNIKTIKPYSYIPFGEGPRICIGNRFAQMQLKLAIFALLRRFKVALSDKTPVPIKYEIKTFMYNSEGGLWIRFIDRSKSNLGYSEN